MVDTGPTTYSQWRKEIIFIYKSIVYKWGNIIPQKVTQLLDLFTPLIRYPNIENPSNCREDS